MFSDFPFLLPFPFSWLGKKLALGLEAQPRRHALGAGQSRPTVFLSAYHVKMRMGQFAFDVEGSPQYDTASFMQRPPSFGEGLDWQAGHV